MKAFALLLASATIVVAGCGKTEEARRAVKAATSTTVGAALEAAKATAGQASTGEVDLTEATIRRYFTAVTRLKQKHPGIGFENAVVAAVEAEATGKNLEKVVPAETDLSFAEYAATSAAIMEVLAVGSVAQMGAMVPQLEAVVKQLEATDSSQMTAEQKAQHQATITEQKRALEEARAQDTPEARAAAEQFQTIMRVSQEMGL